MGGMRSPPNRDIGQTCCSNIGFLERMSKCGRSARLKTSFREPLCIKLIQARLAIAFASCFCAGPKLARGTSRRLSALHEHWPPHPYRREANRLLPGGPVACFSAPASQSSPQSVSLTPLSGNEWEDFVRSFHNHDRVRGRSTHV
jgi:hypothetical protein